MSILTTEHPRAAVPRSRAARVADGVVAGYIRSLARADRVAEAPRRRRSPAFMEPRADEALAEPHADEVLAEPHEHKPRRAASAWCFGAARLGPGCAAAAAA